MPTIHPPSKLERWLRGGGYILVGTVGLYLLLDPPNGNGRLGDALGYWLTALWCVFMLTGIPAGIAAILGRYRGEYMLLPYFTAAVVIADIRQFGLGVQATWIGIEILDEQSFLRALLYGALALVYLARFVTLRRLVRIGMALERRGWHWWHWHRERN